MIFVRLVLYLSLATPFGLALFTLRDPRVAAAIRVRSWLFVAVAAALAASVVWLALASAQMAGLPVWPIDTDTLGVVLSGTSVGSAWIARLAALLVAGMAAGSRQGGLATYAAAAGLALATLAWAGHGAVDDGAVGWLHLVATIVHLLASGVWLGALTGLTLLLTRPALIEDGELLLAAHRALRAFGPVGTVVVGLLVATGAIQSWLLVGPGNFAAPWATVYGRLLLAKLFLFVLMLALAAVNRFRLTPDLGQGVSGGEVRPTIGSLRLSLAVETFLAVTVIAVVAWLGVLAPPVAGA